METQKNRWSQHVVILFLPLMLLLFSQSLAHGGQWTSVAPPSIGHYWYLNGVHFTSSDEGWAVGEDYQNKKGVLLHYSKGSWKSVNPPTVSTDWTLSGVHLTSADEGWAVGTDNAHAKGVLLHYSGGAWTSVTPPTSVSSTNWWLNAVHFTSTDDGWTVGVDGTNHTAVLLHYYNKAWTQYPLSAGNYWQPYAVHFTSADEGWAVGFDGTTGLLLHYSGGTWTSVTPPTIGLGSHLYGIHFTSTDEGWAVGVDGTTGLLLHYSGGTWTSVTPPTVSSSWYLNGVHFTSADNGWAVGGYNNAPSDGVLLQYTSGTWTSVTPPTVSSSWYLSGIHFTSEGEGWAVGSGYTGFEGVLLHYDSGIRALTVGATGAGSGSVTSSPAGIDCGSTCSAEFTKGTKVTLTPRPDWGSSFASWSGGCKGKTTCTVTMSKDISVTADFSSTACSYSISPSLKNVSYKGGTAKITIKGTGSTYCAVPKPGTDADWITFDDYSFSGAKGTVVLGIGALDSSIARTGTITIDGITLLTINQAGKPCTIGLTFTSSEPLSSGGADSSFDFTTNPADCAWTAKSGASWLTISSDTSGTGGGKMYYNVTANNTKGARNSKITITTTLNKKSKNYTVKQAKP